MLPVLVCVIWVYLVVAYVNYRFQSLLKIVYVKKEIYVKERKCHYKDDSVGNYRAWVWCLGGFFFSVSFCFGFLLFFLD